MRYLLIALILCGCYNQKKATVQHGRAVVTYPAIGADYCARTYPSRDSILPGKTITTTDTLWAEGESRTDTVFVAGKPIEVTKTIILPGKVITNTILRTDTVYKENTAALDLCRIDLRTANNNLSSEQAEKKKYQNRARKYLYGLIGAGALLGLWLFFKLRKPKK